MYRFRADYNRYLDIGRYTHGDLNVAVTNRSVALLNIYLLFLLILSFLIELIFKVSRAAIVEFLVTCDSRSLFDTITVYLFHV